MKYICKVCGYVYDDAQQKVPFDQLPETWKCPVCGAPKSAFAVQEEKVSVKKPIKPVDNTLKELSFGELSVLFSNLARGCEKQYKQEAQKMFSELSSYFADRTPLPENPTMEKLIALVRKNLEEDYPFCNETAKEQGDRGTQRICVWGQKVTTMLSLLLERYQAEGETFLENTNVWVCGVCGFIYIGETAPALCPVCKVPDWKFEKIEGGKQ